MYWLKSIQSPDGARFTVNKSNADQFGGLLDDFAMAGYPVKAEQSGGFNPRTIAGTTTPSRHAWGEAIDVNWTDNPRGSSGTIDPDLARSLAAKHGLTWGGDWKNSDPMHFEVSGSGPKLAPLRLLDLENGRNARSFGTQGGQPVAPRDYAWNDVLPIEAAQPSSPSVPPPSSPSAQPMGFGGGGLPPQTAQAAAQPQQPTFMDQLRSRLLNPLTLAGLAGLESASRGGSAFEGISKGMQTGMAFDQMRDSEAQKQRVQALFQNANGMLGGVPPSLLTIARATGDVKPLTDFMIKQAAERTDDIKEYEYALQRGFKGSLQDWMINKRASQGEYNKTPVYGTRTGPDGKPETVMLQTGSRGDAVATKLPEGVAVNAQKPIEVDAGTHTVLLDPITRTPIAQIPKNKGEVERQKVIGEAQGKALADLPSVQSNADNLIRYIDAVATDPNLDKMIGYKGYLRNVTPEARTLQSKVDQIKGQAFLIAFQNLKGAGAITEMEGAKATAALGRLQEMVQSGQDYRQALKDFRTEVERLVSVAKTKAGGGGSAPASGNAWGVRRLD